jgi:type IV secretory pathway VirB10-like protein
MENDQHSGSEPVLQTDTSTPTTEAPTQNSASFGEAPGGYASKKRPAFNRQLRKWPVVAIGLFGIGMAGMSAWGYLGPKSPFQWAASSSAKMDTKPGPGKATVVMANAPETVSINAADPKLSLPPESSMVGSTAAVAAGSGSLEGANATNANMNGAASGNDYNQQVRAQRDQMQMQMDMQRQQEAAQRYQQRQQQLQVAREAPSTVYAADVGNPQPGAPSGNNQSPLQGIVSGSNASAYLPHTRLLAISPYEVKAGTVIPSVMLSGINSDLPGEIIAQVVQNVYDSATGKYLIVPQGAKLVGAYDHDVVMGQKRVLISWNRIIYPDSSSVEIEGMAGQDQAGYAGFKDKTNNHVFPAIRSALLMSAITAGAQLSQPRASRGDYSYSSQQIAAASLGQQLNQLGMASYSSRVNMPPTITIRPGYRFNVMVNRDMVLAPWQGQAAQTNVRYQSAMGGF